MGDAEVDDDRVVVEHEDVAGLEVAVDDVDVVDGAQGLGQATREGEQALRTEGAVLPDALLEAGSGDVAGDDVGLLGLEVGVEDRGDPLGAHPRQGVDLASQSRSRVLVVGHVGAQDLDRHCPAPGVQGEVDDAHPALPQLLEHPVGTDGVEVGHTHIPTPVRGGVVPEELSRHAPKSRRLRMGGVGASPVCLLRDRPTG